MNWGDAITSFVALFVVMDPISIAPLFLALTAGTPEPARRRIAVRGIAFAAALLTLFGLAGEQILSGIGISLAAFRISGGIMLFMTALDMLFEGRAARRQRSADETGTTHDDGGDDPSIFPLATPLIAGPGALATMVLLVGEHDGDPVGQASVFGAMFLVLSATLGLFLLAGRIEGLLGPTGVRVLSRIFGVLLGALAVQFVLTGLADFGFVAR